MKRIANKCLLVSVFLVSVVTSALDYGTSRPAHFPFAYVGRDCAATDAIALNFYFTPEKSDCGKHREPLIMISVMRNLPTSAPYSVHLDGNVAAGFRCLRQGVCERAASGTLRLGAFTEGESASGEYELHFQDGSVEKASLSSSRTPPSHGHKYGTPTVRQSDCELRVARHFPVQIQSRLPVFTTLTRSL
jgi:hypothetical protein